MFSIHPSVIRQIVRRYKTPIYVYDDTALRECCARVDRALASFHPHFSLKANPCPGICKIIATCGIGAEVSSEFEARIALDAGFPASGVMYDGPAKTKDEIDHALKAGIRHFNFESVAELKRLCQVGKQNGILGELQLCARINPRQSSSADEVMTGIGSRFGVDAETVVRQLKECGCRKIDGVHLYIGSQIMDANEIVRNFRTGLAALRDLVNEGLIRENKMTLVFGPGIGVPYVDATCPVDLSCIATGMDGCLRQYRRDGITPHVKMEMGRALVAQCGVYVVSVVETKVSRGKQFVIVDGGINHFMRYALTNAHHRIQLIDSLEEPTCLASIVGPSCTPHDILAECDIPRIEEGNLLCVRDAGAYGWSMGMSHFMSRATAPEILVSDGGNSVLRRRSSYEDYKSLCE